MRNIFILILVVSFNGLFSQDNLKVYMDEAGAFIQQKEYKSAIKKYEEALSQSPSYIPAISGKVIALYFGGNAKEALRFVDKSLKKYSQEPQLYFDRGVLRYYDGSYKEAIKDFDKALEFDSDILDKIYLNRGKAYESMERKEEAMQDYDASIEAKPNNSQAYYARGVLLFKQIEYQAAINDFTRVIEIEDNNATAYYNRAITYLRIKKNTLACVDFHKACKFGNRNACKKIISECSRIGKQ